jgi:hypothetical protein
VCGWGDWWWKKEKPPASLRAVQVTTRDASKQETAVVVTTLIFLFASTIQCKTKFWPQLFEYLSEYLELRYQLILFADRYQQNLGAVEVSVPAPCDGSTFLENRTLVMFMYKIGVSFLPAKVV